MQPTVVVVVIIFVVIRLCDRTFEFLYAMRLNIGPHVDMLFICLLRNQYLLFVVRIHIFLYIYD